MSSLFLKDLERYADSPEDVGHCFVTWVGRVERVEPLPIRSLGETIPYLLRGVLQKQ